jgi:virulence factor
MQRVALVGLGDIARKAYLPLLSAWDGVELLVCSRTPDSVAQIRERYHLARGTTDLDELLSWRPHAAFVLTPSASHAALVGTFLEAGIDVFVEKPATLTSGATLSLADQAERSGRILMVGFNRRFAPLHRRARDLWGDRPVGLCLFQKNRTSPAHPDLLSNYIDDTIHLIDLLRFFCGEAEAVETVQTVREGRLVQALSIAALGAGGHALVATSLDAGEWRESLSLQGQGASLALEAFSSLRFVQGGEERTWHEGYARDWKPTLEARGFSGQIAHFFECVASRQSPLTSGAEAFRTQRLLEEMVGRVRA